MKQYFRMYKKHPKAVALRILVTAAAALTVLVLFFAGVLHPHQGHSQPEAAHCLQWKYTSKNASMMPAIINTITMVLMTLLIAVPFGIGSAIYLTEYAKRGNKAGAGDPHYHRDPLGHSVHCLWSVRLSGFCALRWTGDTASWLVALTLAIMILPLIMRTTEEALQAVPDQLPGRQLRPGRRTSCAPSSGWCCRRLCRASSPASFWRSAVSSARRPP